MVDVARIIDRLRANGAQVFLEDDGLRIVNARNLPAGAMEFIDQHKGEIVSFLRATTDPATPELRFGSLTRETADGIARLLMRHAPDDPDWTWFVGEAMKIMDTVALPRAAQ